MESELSMENKTSNNYIYMAPLEGITGYIFRNAYNKIYGNVDKYFAPFISSKSTGMYKGRELRDIIPENNKEINLVPQILSCNSIDFINLAKIIMDMGYQEINLNTGCPSPTVVSKGKGAAFLYDTYAMEKFFDAIFMADLCHISIKTRIGCYDEEEFDNVIRVIVKYPFSEIIVHPRLLDDYYRNTPRLKSFSKIYEKYADINIDSLCYNGDINTASDYEHIKEEFPLCGSIMIGRGILKNPSLVSEIRQEESIPCIIKFHDEVYQSYKEYMSGDKNVLFKMKELWSYMSQCILLDERDRMMKKIRKCGSCKEYESVVMEIWNNSLCTN